MASANCQIDATLINLFLMKIWVTESLSFPLTLIFSNGECFLIFARLDLSVEVTSAAGRHMTTLYQNFVNLIVVEALIAMTIHFVAP